MNVILCSVPVESPGFKLRRKRSEGPMPILPKSAITQLNDWAEKNKFPTCKFYDVDMLYPNDEEVEKYFRENNADVVGLSAVVSTSYKQVKRLAHIIKKVNPNAMIVCGGYLTNAANTILRKTDIDICVLGDGEIPWVGILNTMKEHLNSGRNKIDIDNLLKVKGIAVLDDNGELKFSGYAPKLSNCHTQPPSLEFLRKGLLGNEEAFKAHFKPFEKTEMFHFDDRAYEKGRKPMAISIFTSKGCVAKCTFCQRGSKGYSIYDLDKLEAHIKELSENYNVGYLIIIDENFGSNKKYAYQVAELFNKYNLLWACCGVRCSSVTKEDLIFYKKNGCSTMTFGIESGSQTMLDIMEKKFTVEDIKKAVYTAIDIDLYTNVAGFMVGLPGETFRTARESGKLMGEMAAKFGVPPGLLYANCDINYALPLIGTPLYEYGKQLGLIGQTVEEEEKYLEIVSNNAAYKRYYMNFNGAPISEVLFWDMLIYLEATRTYIKLMKNKTINEKNLKKFIMRAKLKGDNPHSQLNKKKKMKSISVMGGSGVADVAINQYFFSSFVKEKIVFNEKVAKLPRFIVNPIVRWGLYLEFLVQKYFFKDKNNLHTDAFSLARQKKMSSKMRIQYKDVDPLKTTQRDRSLRTIVRKKMEAKNRTREEVTASLLTGGA